LKSLCSLGHSNHPITKFIELLTTHQIATLVDVRSYPSSRRWPQFNQGALAASLSHATIEYSWFPTLGGRRSSQRVDSPHTAWEVPAFRAYADYAETTDFDQGLRALIALAEARNIAFMCSEGLWWQCHRRIIADHLTVRGYRVQHITPNGRLVAHQIPDFASIHNGRLIYDGGQIPLGLKRDWKN
jgi:uncharacterized protein (DUF488 family)